MESQAVRFTETARSLANRARSLGLQAPVFRSPPKIVGVRRTLRRRSDGEVVVAVAYKGRPWGAVVSDLIDAVVVVNELDQVAAGRARDELWSEVAAQQLLAA